MIQFLLGRPGEFEHGFSREKALSYIPMIFGIFRLFGRDWATQENAEAAVGFFMSLAAAADVAWDALFPFVMQMFMFAQRHWRKN